jgi:hypothetical protein
MMRLQLKPRWSTLGFALSVLAIVLVAVLIQYGQVFLTGSAPQPLVWVFGTIAVAIVTQRAVARRR